MTLADSDLAGWGDGHPPDQVVTSRTDIGLDKEAAIAAFSEFLTDTTYSTQEIRFIQLIVDELTVNGVVPASRLYEAPFTDHAPTGPGMLFPGADGDRLFLILDEVRSNARPDIGVA